MAVFKKHIGITSKMNRYREVVGILVKHGFGEIFHVKYKIKSINSHEQGVYFELSRWERIRVAIEELGTTFIKLGQMLSNRPDVIPEGLLVELRKLQESVPSFRTEEAQQIFLDDFNQNVKEAFKYFNPDPIASASIAQVHEAILKTGEKVAVKIQRPGISKQIFTDIEIMQGILKLFEKHNHDIENLQLSNHIKEFERSLRNELDFRIEAMNIERFRKNFENNKHFYVPKVYHDIVSENVLTMEYIHGAVPTDFEALKRMNLDPAIIASRGTDYIIQQIFEYGFFHADPHAGNIRIMKDNVLCFLDYGMVGSILPRQRELLLEMIIAFIRQDSNALLDSLLSLCDRSLVENRDDLERSVDELVAKFSYMPVKQIDSGQIIQEMMDLVYTHQLTLPGNFLMLAKSLVTIEGVARELLPDFNFKEQIKPYGRNLLKSKFDIKKLTKEGISTFLDSYKLMKNMPRYIKDILILFKKGEISVRFDFKELHYVIRKLEQISNRLSFAIILAALILSSALIMHAGIPPLWQGISLIGAGGFLISGFMIIVYFMHAIFRNRV